MAVTSNEANKLLKAYQEELVRVKSIETLSSSFRISSNEKEEDVKPVYDFIETQKLIVGLCGQIVKIKHAINKFNLETVLPCGLTIDQALVYLPLLNRELSKLSEMKTRLAKQRCRSYSSEAVEYNVANYDIDLALQQYRQVSGEIEIIQKELDIVNNTTTFEIEGL